MNRNGADPRTFQERLDKIDRDHVEAVRIIQRNHRRMNWVLWIAVGLNVAAGAYQVIRLSQ